jgi:hypothetical protein
MNFGEASSPATTVFEVPASVEATTEESIGASRASGTMS